VKGKGVNLPDFDSDLPIANLPLVVQLRNNSSGICWRARSRPREEPGRSVQREAALIV
jgi:hypothetical protein